MGDEEEAKKQINTSLNKMMEDDKEEEIPNNEFEVVFIDALHSKEKEEQSLKFDGEMNKLKDFIMKNQPYKTTISNYGLYKIMYNMMNNYIEARDSQDQNMKAETNFCGYSSCSKWRWQYF